MSQYSSLPPISDDHPSSPEPVSHRDNHSPNDYLAFQNESATAATPCKPSFPTRTNRPSRACTIRAAERLLAAQSVVERKPKGKKELRSEQNEETPLHLQQQQCSKIVTQLVEPPSPSQLPRWNLRSMWELASVLNFLNVFRPLLNINVEFSAEEFESALISPNDTLSDVHIPLLKAIPPVTRMALTRKSWVTVLCRKLRDWWFWVADGDLPLVASHGAEVEVYRTLDPGIRVVILKALCDIRVEQEDIRNYIDNSLKHDVQLSAFRKERIGGDSHGIFYWYEEDSLVGHRLYREIRKVELKKTKARGSHILPSSTYQWETIATSFDEFQDVSEKLFSSKNRSEVSLGKKLKIDMLPEIEKVHKRKERLLKKQHRQALLLDNFINIEDLGPGRSLRDRKPVTYTFDDYDRSINEAIKITKQKQPSPATDNRREVFEKPEPSSNGKWIGPSYESENFTFSALSPESLEYEETEEDQKMEDLDRSNRRRQRPQRYSAKEFVEAVSDNEADSDDDIVGEAVYDEEYLRQRKQRKKILSSSEGDEEYHYEEENGEDEEEEEEEDDDDEEFSPSASDDSIERRKLRKLPRHHWRRASKLRSVDELQSGLRRSKRARKSRINYKQYEMSESESESTKAEKSNESEQHSDAEASENEKSNESEQHSDAEASENEKSNESDQRSDAEASENGDFSPEESPDSDGGNEDEEIKNDQSIKRYPEKAGTNNQPLEKSSSSPSRDETNGIQGRRFLDLNELAPGSGFDDGPNSVTKVDDQTNDF